MAVAAVPDWYGEAASPTFEDLTTNGDFSVGTDWTLGSGASIAAGVLSWDGSQVSNSAVTQTPATALKLQRIICYITVVSVSAGAVRLTAGNDASAWYSAPGTYRAMLYPTSGTDIGIEADPSFVGDVDDVMFHQYSAVPDFRWGRYGPGYAYRVQGRLWGGAYGGGAGFEGAGNGFAFGEEPPDPQGLPSDMDPRLTIDRDTDVTGAVEPVAGVPGTATIIAPEMHGDYHFKLWVIPPLLQLTNPQLNTNIGFRLWNTWSDPETISAINVLGSSVLSFDIGPGTTLNDGEYRLANMQIGPGEPSVEATVEFVTENLTGLLTVFAAISDTFNLIPDVPVRERWDFLTDILTSYEGAEQRVSLRPRPRIEQDFIVNIVNTDQRRQQWQLLSKNIQVQSLVPFYQYSTQLTAESSIGATRIYFDPQRTNMRDGEFLVIVNPKTEDLIISRVTTVEVDGASLNSSITFDVNKKWIVAPAFNCILGDGSGVTMNKVTGELRVNAKTFTEPSLLRPNEATTLSTLDGFPILERRPLIPAREDWEYEREVLDNQTGKRDLNSRHLHGRVRGQRKFVVQRVQTQTEMDYWRKFFNVVKGAWKPFLLPTYFPDLTLTAGQSPLAQAASGFDVNEGDYASLYFPYDTWKRIAIEFDGGLVHYATMTGATANEDGTATLSFTPSLPDDPAYTVPTVISYLTKMRAEDKISWEHYADVSYISFGVKTTDEG